MRSAELTTPGARPRTVSRLDRRARVCASAGFAVQGLSFAAVISQVQVLRDKFGLDDTQLTVTLAAVPIIAGVGSVLAGVFAPRVGSGPVLRVAALGVAVMTAATGFADQIALFYAAVALFGLFLGAVDASMNMQGTAVQRRYGRSILASCHAWWSIAGIAAAAAALLAADRIPQREFLAGAAAVGVVISLIAGPGLLKKAQEAEEPAAEAAAGVAPVVARRGWTVAFIGIALMVDVHWRRRHDELEHGLSQGRALGHAHDRPSRTLRLPGLPVPRSDDGRLGSSAGSVLSARYRSAPWSRPADSWWSRPRRNGSWRWPALRWLGLGCRSSCH